MKMRKEYDFSKAERGKYFGRVRVVGPVEDEPVKNSSTAAAKVQRSLEADLKKLGLWNMLDRDKQTELRRTWKEKLSKALA